MTRKEIEQSLNWLTNTLVKVAKNCNVKIDGEVEAINANIDCVTAVNSIAFVTLAETGQIDDVTASEHPEMFEEWKPSMAYTEGQLRVDPLDGKLYRVNKGKSHTSQEGWNPSLCPSEWKLTSDPAEEFPAWSQPIGAHDAYHIGNKVTHDEKKWVCTEVDANGNNTWPPGVYGWTEYVEETAEV